ncbi:unnamed protein product [Meloidogyne enterolobii]|uniref:Uncharacterized protein n=1 Tax=Meloidogyne enterolobii TaxID=390850 RepID=A0ACB0XRW2_MELEN
MIIYSEGSILRLMTDKLREIATRFKEFKEFKKECLNFIRWFEVIFTELEYIKALKNCIEDVKKYLELL